MYPFMDFNDNQLFFFFFPLGAVMEELAGQLLGVSICPYMPQHTRNLANEFRCYSNYETKFLSKPNT